MGKVRRGGRVRKRGKTPAGRRNIAKRQKAEAEVRAIIGKKKPRRAAETEWADREFKKRHPDRLEPKWVNERDYLPPSDKPEARTGTTQVDRISRRRRIRFSTN